MDYAKQKWECILTGPLNDTEGANTICVIREGELPWEGHAAICSISVVDKLTEKDRENAALIIAAPKMYKMLKSISFGHIDLLEVGSLLRSIDDTDPFPEGFETLPA